MPRPTGGLGLFGGEGPGVRELGAIDVGLVSQRDEFSIERLRLLPIARQLGGSGGTRWSEASNSTRACGAATRRAIAAWSAVRSALSFAPTHLTSS